MDAKSIITGILLAIFKPFKMKYPMNRFKIKKKIMVAVTQARYSELSFLPNW